MTPLAPSSEAEAVVALAGNADSLVGDFEVSEEFINHRPKVKITASTNSVQ